jgi:integrase
MRWGEAVGLKVKAVDLFAKQATVFEQLQELPNTAELVWTSPKSKMSRRTVPLPAYVVDALVPLISGRERDQVVFTAALGGLVRYRVFWRTWSKVTEQAGLAGLRIHDLRHTHAAWLISAGIPLTAIQRRLGHASIAMTSDRYGHLMPVVDANIVAALDAALPGLALGEVGESVGESGTEQLGSTRNSGGVPAGQAA